MSAGLGLAARGCAAALAVATGDVLGQGEGYLITACGLGKSNGEIVAQV